MNANHRSPLGAAAPRRRALYYGLFTVLPLALLPASIALTPLSVGSMLLLVLLLVSATTDLRHRKIYNWLSYPVFGWAVLLSGLGTLAPASWGLEPLLDSVLPLGECLAGGLVSAGVMLAIYSVAGGGAGDVKLAIAIGALVGPELTLWAIAVSYLLAASFVTVDSLLTRRLRLLGPATLRLLGAQLAPERVQPPTAEQRRFLRRPIPLAGFFAVGTLLVVMGS